MSVLEIASVRVQGSGYREQDGAVQSRASKTQVVHSNFCFVEGGGTAVVAVTLTATVTVPVTALPEVQCDPPAFSHSQLDVFLTCLGLTRGPHLFWRQATGASIYVAHIMGKQPQTQIPVSGVFQCWFSRLPMS